MRHGSLPFPDTTPLQVVAVYRIQRRPWPEMTERVGALLDEFPGPATHDATGAGSAIGEFQALAPHEEVDRDELADVIRQKRTPGLGRRGPTTHHVVPDRGFGDRDTEFQQLAVDARGTPGRVGVAHLAYEHLNGARDAWPTGSARPTLPAPIAPKPSSMPPENGVGLDDDERSPPSGPQVTEPRPEQPVNGPQPRAPAGLSLQDRSLMTKRRVLNLERRLALQA